MSPNSYARGVALTLALAVSPGCMPTAGATPDATADEDARVDAASKDTSSDVTLPDAPLPDRPDDGDGPDAPPTADVALDRPELLDSAMDAGQDAPPDALADAGGELPIARDALADAADVASGPDASVDAAPDAPVDAAPDASGLPPVEVFEGALPAASRASAGWAPLRITHRVAAESGLTTVDRLVFAYSDRRVNAVTTERWSGAAWAPYEMTTYTYGATGAVNGRFVWRYFARWTEHQRWRYEFNADGTLRVEHGDIRSGGAWAETMQRTWQWVGRLPGWQRYQEAPAPGMLSVTLWENAYDYDAAGRLTGYLRTERRRPTDPFLVGGRQVLTVRPTGHLDRDTFVYASTRTDTVYRYNRVGSLVEVAAPDTVNRYLYDATGRLQFVRSYVRFDATWSLSAETELEHTTEASDAAFALGVDPFESWRRDYYGRGDVVDRYRR